MEGRSRSKSPQSEFLPEIRRGRIGSLTIYDVSEGELEILERGSPDSIYLNFSIGLLSNCVSFLIALATTSATSLSAKIFLISSTIITGINGTFLLILWFRNRRTVPGLIQRIKDRVPPQGEPAAPIGPSASGEKTNE